MRTTSFAIAATVLMLLAKSAAAQDTTPPATQPTEPPATSQPPPTTTTTTPSETTASVDTSILAKKEWYGGQIIIADVVGTGFMALGAILGATSPSMGTNAYGIAAPGVAVYAIGAPTIHALHDNTTNGVKSMLARMLLPTLGAAVGGLVGQIATGSDEKSPLHGSSGLYYGGAIGAGAGAIAAMVIDCAAWAHKDTATTTESTPPAPPPPSGLRVAPTVAAAPTGGMAGIAGSF